MATNTGVRCIAVNPVMALVTGDTGCMGPGQGPVVVVNGERGRFPPRIGRVAICTGRGYAGGCVIGIGCGIIIRKVTGGAGT